MQTSYVSLIHVLEEIQEKGFLKPDTFLQYRQKLSHAFALFLNQTPVVPGQAESCLEVLNTVSQGNRAFFSLYQDTAMDLHDWATAGDELTRAQADIQLLRFFEFESPASVKLKKQLLEKIKNMPKLHEKHALLADTLYNLSNHYEQNHQYNEDPKKECLSSISKVINSIAKHTKKLSAEEKVKLSYVADKVQTYTPEFYDEAWEKIFTQKHTQKASVPNIKEAVDICSRKGFHSKGYNFSRGWDRE